jgi:hypothetical protein
VGPRLLARLPSWLGLALLSTARAFFRRFFLLKRISTVNDYSYEWYQQNSFFLPIYDAKILRWF